MFALTVKNHFFLHIRQKVCDSTLINVSLVLLNINVNNFINA